MEKNLFLIPFSFSTVIPVEGSSCSYSCDKNKYKKLYFVLVSDYRNCEFLLTTGRVFASKE